MADGQMPSRLRLYSELIHQTSTRQLAYRARRILRRLFLDRLLRPFATPANSTKALGSFLQHAPGMQEVGQSYLNAETDKARAKLQAALDGATPDRWPFANAFWEKTAQSLCESHTELATTLRQEAERTLDRQFVSEGSKPLELGRMINWDPPEFSHCEKTYALNRLYHLPLLALMARADSDRRYSDEIVDLVTQWITANHVQKGNPWNELTTSLRLNHVLLAWAILRDTDMLDARAHEAVLLILLSHARYLKSHMEFDILNNHLVFEGRTLLMASLLFPEQPEAREWRSTALQVLESELEHEVREDGTHAEQSAGYHMQVLLEYLVSSKLLKEASMDLPDGWHDTLQKMHECLSDMLRPDGRPPLSGDTALHDPQTPYADDVLLVAEHVLESPALRTGGMVSLRSLLVLGPDLPVLTGPLRSTRSNSVIRHEGGFVVMRSRENHPRISLQLDAGPFAMPDSPAHGHADALHLELAVGDTPILVDPGAYTYEAGVWRNHFRGTQAHNTVSADRRDQNIIWGAFRSYKPVDGRILDYDLNGEVQWVRCEVNHSTCQLAHRRLLMLLPDSLLLLVDDITSHGVKQVSSSFQFAPLQLNQITSTHPGWLAGNEKDHVVMNLLCMPGDQIDVVSGQEEPPRGWISEAKGTRKKAPHLCWNRKATGKDRMIALFTPVDNPDHPDLPELTLEGQDILIRFKSCEARVNPARPAGTRSC